MSVEVASIRSKRSRFAPVTSGCAVTNIRRNWPPAPRLLCGGMSAQSWGTRTMPAVGTIKTDVAALARVSAKPRSSVKETSSLIAWSLSAAVSV